MVSVRVLVSGSWQKIPVVNNGLFLDLPGLTRSDVSTVAVTFSDGSTQRHDLQTGIQADTEPSRAPVFGNVPRP